MIGENSFLTERGLIKLNGVSVGPEQDWTETSGSWMGSGRSDSFAIAAKILLVEQSIPFDEAVDGYKNVDKPKDIRKRKEEVSEEAQREEAR